MIPAANPTAHPTRVPPHDIEAERAVICSLLIDPDSISDTKEIVGPDDFYRTSHPPVMEAIYDLHDQEQPVDVVTVRDRLREKGELERVGGEDALGDLAGASPSAANVLHYARIVRKLSVARQGIEIQRNALESLYGDGAVVEILDEAATALTRLREDAGSTERSLFSPAADSLPVIPFGFVSEGLHCGLATLDAALYGIRPGWIVIEGDSGLGKSVLVTQIAEGIIERGGSVLAVPLEDTLETWFGYALARRCSLDGRAIITGDLTDDQKEVVTRAFEVADGHPDLFGDVPVRNQMDRLLLPGRRVVTVSTFRRMVERFARENLDKPGAVILDPLHRLAPDAVHLMSGKTEYERIQDSIVICADLSHEFGIPIISTVHMNAEGLPKGSYSFIHSADIRLRLERPDDGPEDLPTGDVRRTLKILKNKGLPAGQKIHLPLRKKSARFYDEGEV